MLWLAARPCGADSGCLRLALAATPVCSGVGQLGTDKGASGVECACAAFARTSPADTLASESPSGAAAARRH